MKKRYMSTILVGLSVVVLLALFLKTIGLFDSKIKTYPATLGKIEVDLEKTAIALRDETLLSSNVEGTVEFLVEEAQRVYRSQSVAVITPKKLPEKKEEEKENDKEIDFTQYMVDVEVIRSNIKSLEDELSYLVKQNKYAEIEDVRARLTSFYLVQQAFEKQGGIKPAEAIVSVNSDSGHYVVSAPKAGLIGLETSLYDKLFTLGNIHLIQYNKLPELPESQVKREVRPGDIFLRIVDNKNSFLVTELTPEELGYFKLGNLCEIHIGEAQIFAEIYQIVQTEQQTGIIFRIFEDYPKMTEYRSVKVKLIPEKTEGIIIKSTSIIEQEGQVGVKVLSPSGVVRFVPIKIKARVGDQAVIHSDFYTLGQAEGTNESIKTVNLYDEIVEAP